MKYKSEIAYIHNIFIVLLLKMGNECNPVCGPMHFANNEQQISNNVRPIGVENQSDTSTDQSVTNN